MSSKIGAVALPTDLNRDSIEKILQDFYKNPKLSVTQVSGQEVFLGDNENFASDIKSWTVTVQDGEEGSPEKQVSFVVKSSSNASFFKKFSPIWRPFAKELFWFKRAHPTLTKICPEIKGITPVCFYGYSTYDERMFRPTSFIDKSMLVLVKMFTKKQEIGLILLENMRSGEKPMKMLDKTKIMTVNQVRVVFQTLARLHGSWLKWRHISANEKESENGILNRHIEALSLEMAPWMIKQSVEKTQRAYPKLLRNYKRDEELIRRWEVYGREKMLKRNLELGTTKKEMEKSKIVTFCHGDTWTNNMMFSEDESEVVLLDYQLTGILHPAKDLWYFLSLATDADFRRAHLHDLLKDYFDVFEKYLKDAEIEMTFEQFEAEVNERRDLLFFFGADLMPTVMNPKKLEFATWSSLKDLELQREEDIGGEPKEDDHPNIKEIRRRLVAMIEEAAEYNFI